MKTFFFLWLTLSLWGAGEINSSIPVTSTGTLNIAQIQNDKQVLWVDEQIDAIIPPRSGVPEGFVNALSDPVKYKVPPKPVKSVLDVVLPKIKTSKETNATLPALPKIIEEPLRLQALMNTSALINGKWYRINDTVRTYTLAEVRQNSVLLTSKKGQPLILFFVKSVNSNIVNTN